MIKIILLLMSLNCIAQETNECNISKEESSVSDIRCFEVKGDRVYESRFTVDDELPITMFFHITPEELETEYEKVD